jgi:hypothetical protein
LKIPCFLKRPDLINIKTDERLFYRVMQQINQFSHQIDKERNILNNR